MHIGVYDLKQVLFVALLPQISKWSQGYNLTPADVNLWQKNWVEIVPASTLIPGAMDVDAIADEFFVAKRATKNMPKSDGKTFKTGDITVQLELPLETYQAILNHIEEVSVL